MEIDSLVSIQAELIQPCFLIASGPLREIFIDDHVSNKVKNFSFKLL